jgi:Family of unknown function (DUF5329)
MFAQPISKMTSRTFLHAALAFAFSLVAILPSRAAPAMSEKAKIESLISHVENFKDATFIRNGSDYDAKSAAKFLRGKWQANDKDIKTAADFIVKAATLSSTTGGPYLIRFKNGTHVKCGDYLTAELRKLDAEKN